MKVRTSFLSVLILLFVVVLALLSPSCVSPPAVTEAVVTRVPVTKEVPTKEPEVPVYLVGQTSGDARDELDRYLMDQCGVKYELIEGEYWSILEARLAAGEPFDIIQMDTVHLPAYAERKDLYPVDDPARTALDSFFEPLVRAFTFEGEPYGVPRDSDALVLFYNVDRFAEAGLDEPNDGWSWEDLRKHARILTEATGMVGFSVPAEPYYFYTFVLQAGGGFMTEDFSDTWIDYPEAIEAGHFYTGAREEGWAIIPEDSGATWYGEAFARGDVDMVLGGYWMQGYLSGRFPDLAYGVVHAPAGPYGPGTVAFPTAYVVSVNSRAPQAAWKAIDCLTSEEAQALMLDSGVALPSRRGFEGHPFMEENRVARAVYTSLEFSSPYAWGFYHDEVSGIIRDALRRVFYDEWGVAESFGVAAEDIRAIIWQ